MDSSFFVEHDSSLSNIDSKLQPFLSEISSQLQGLFPGQNTPAQLTQTYDTTDLKSLQALIKAESSQQMSQPLLATDNAGNTLATARNIGNLTGTRNFSDFVGAIDTNDYYRFSLTTLSSGSISINNTTANTGIQFLNSSGGVIDSFTTNGTEGNALFGEFNAGTYYVRIYPIGGANTNYNLNLVAFPGGFGEG